MKKLDKLLTKILIFSLILFIFSLFFTKTRRNSPKSIESALLNPKYKNEVAQIEIQIPSQNRAITLKKQGDFWLLVKNADEGKSEITTFADKKLVTSLIEKACEIRKLYQISDKESDFDQLKTSENAGSTLTFVENDNKMYTKLHFGSTNPLTNRTFVRSQGSKIIYETENDLSHFLNSETNYWSEGEILSEIISKGSNPVEISFEEKSTKSSLNEKSPDFAAKSASLLSLRHGSIKDEEEFLSAMHSQNPQPTAVLTVQDGSGRSARIEFFEIEEKGQSESEKSCFYKKNIRPSPADSQENSFAFYSENAVYEISAWTYGKIKSLF